jgi:hypothetical protein
LAGDENDVFRVAFLYYSVNVFNIYAYAKLNDMQERISSKLNLGKKEITLSEINRKFSSTDWGEKLKSNIRYAKHKPEEISDGDWKKILGGDINNLDHLIITKGLTLSFLKGCKNTGKEWEGKIPKEACFSEEEQQLLLLTASMHDWGEAVKGDIHYYDKTKQDDIEEMQELRTIINEILSEILGEKHNLDIKRIIDKIINILTQTESKLGKAFNAIEKVGYVRTSIRAYDKSIIASEELKIPLRNMACRVMPDQIRVLVDYAKIYPPVAAYIKHHKETIDKMFKEGENSEIRTSIPKFEESKKKWVSRDI